MVRFVLRRSLWVMLVLFLVSLVTFVLMHSVPGGPFDKEKPLPEKTRKLLEAKYRLDRPFVEQYGYYLYDLLVPRISNEEPTSLLESYLINIPLGGGWSFRWMNFGPSYFNRSRAVSDMIRDQLPVSIQLGLLAMTIALLIGLPMGIIAALKQNSILDYLGMSVAIFGVSVPIIAMAPILQWIFGVALKWLPPTGWGAKPPFYVFFIPQNLSWDQFWRYALMPAFALGVGSSAIIARLTRASLLQTAREDYIRTARAKGLAERVVVMRHALRNSLIPVVTILGPMFAALLTGTFVTEQIFGIPGLGKYFITSITNRDYPVIMGTVLLYAVFLVVANMLVDVTYAWLDPRIRYE